MGVTVSNGSMPSGFIFICCGNCEVRAVTSLDGALYREHLKDHYDSMCIYRLIEESACEDLIEWNVR